MRTSVGHHRAIIFMLTPASEQGFNDDCHRAVPQGSEN
jgi:hypothetical protein